jgi:hypothetical protein
VNKYRHLIVDLTTHVAVTLALVFLIYGLYKDYSLVFLVVLGGILIDIDHFIDYFLYAGLKFNLKKFALIDFLKSGKIYIFLHSWELIVVILLLGYLFNWTKYTLALSLGMAGHIAVDSLYQKTFLPYSLIYRIYNRFEAHKILPCFKCKDKGFDNNCINK